MGDECIVAPLSLFHTELLNITGPGKLAKVQKPARQQPDSEDCFDAEYLRETGVRALFLITIQLLYKLIHCLNIIQKFNIGQQRKGAREQLDQNPSEMGGLMNTDNVDEDIVVDTLEVEQRDTKDKEFVLPGGQIIGLDQAVLQSIERCRKWPSITNN